MILTCARVGSAMCVGVMHWCSGSCLPIQGFVVVSDTRRSRGNRQGLVHYCEEIACFGFTLALVHGALVCVHVYRQLVFSALF